jgi:hypothetical protein
MTILVKPVQFSNALSPISVTVPGITTLSSIGQLANARMPIRVSLPPGMNSTLCSISLPTNEAPIVCTLVGTVTLVTHDLGAPV